MTLNQSSCEILKNLDKGKNTLKTTLQLPEGKVTIYDIGVKARLPEEEGMQAGATAAKASAGGLADIKIIKDTIEVRIPKNVALATLGCQMAGWAIQTQNGFMMASGPGRILAKKPKATYDKIGYDESSQTAALILETSSMPDAQTCQYILEKTKAKEAVLAAFPGDTAAGLINILARVVELAVYRLDYLGYDVNKILSAEGTVRIPKNAGMCEANDAVIYHSKVKLGVTEWDDALTGKCISKSAACYGKKFREIYNEAGCDFYRIDEGIFAPASIMVKETTTGITYSAGDEETERTRTYSNCARVNQIKKLPEVDVKTSKKAFFYSVVEAKRISKKVEDGYKPGEHEVRLLVESMATWLINEDKINFLHYFKNIAHLEGYLEDLDNIKKAQKEIDWDIIRKIIEFLLGKILGSYFPYFSGLITKSLETFTYCNEEVERKFVNSKVYENYKILEIFKKAGILLEFWNVFSDCRSIIRIREQFRRREELGEYAKCYRELSEDLMKQIKEPESSYGVLKSQGRRSLVRHKVPKYRYSAGKKRVNSNKTHKTAPVREHTWRGKIVGKYYRKPRKRRY
jgi:methenyltetrahydromethanopterin cyclohydrolase